MNEKTENEEKIKRNLEKKTEELRSVQHRSIEFEARANDFEKANIQLEENNKKLNQTLQEFEVKFEQKQDKIAELERANKDIKFEYEMTIEKQEDKIRKIENELKQLKETLNKKDNEIKNSSELINHYEKTNLELKNKLKKAVQDIEENEMELNSKMHDLEISVYFLL